MFLLKKLSADEVEERRKIQAKAAEERSKDFKQGGGGEKLKAKAKRLEDAENKNRAAFGGPSALQASDLQ